MLRVSIVFNLLIFFCSYEGLLNLNKHSRAFSKNEETKEALVIDTTTILWNKTKKLIWKDFQGKPDSLSEYKAITNTRIKSKCIVFNDDLIEYNFLCQFVKSKSWTKSNSITLLKHEQLHFDIAELATRKLRKNFLEYKYIFKDSINPMVNRYFDEAVLERRKINSLYDKETSHGTIKVKQKEWEIKIANELKKLEAYSSTKVLIKRVKK